MRTSCTPRRTAAAAAVTLGLLLLPMAAAASEPPDPGHATAGADEDATPGTAADGTSGLAAASADDCEPLVSFTVEGTTGDARAVALTAQALERGVEGWAMVAWEAAEGVEISSLTIVATDGGVETRTEGVERGSAENVRELRFCGAGSPPAEHQAPDDGEAPPAPDPGDPAAGDGAENPPSGAPATAVEPDADGVVEAGPGTAGSPDGDGPDAAASGDHGEPEDEAEPSDDPATAEETSADRDEDRDEVGPVAAAASDPEVMGVQLARTGGDLRPLVAGGALGATAGAIVLLTARRRDARGGRA
jgi:hypothetical protein